MPTKKERILLSFFIRFAHMDSLREKTWSEKIALALFQEVSGVGQCLVVCHAGIRMLRVRSPQMQLLHPCVFITHWLSTLAFYFPSHEGADNGDKLDWQPL
jgi:hypothetical protein